MRQGWRAGFVAPWPFGVLDVPAPYLPFLEEARRLRAATVVALTLVDLETKSVLAGPRDRANNRTQWDDISVPTGRISPRRMIDVLSGTDASQLGESSLLFTRTTPAETQHQRAGHDPMISAVRELLARKILGLILEQQGAVTFRTGGGVLALGTAGYPELAGEPIEDILMANFFVVLDNGSSAVPRGTPSYSRLRWVPVSRFRRLVQDRDVSAFLPPGEMRLDDVFRLCVHGMCTTTSLDVIDHTIAEATRGPTTTLSSPSPSPSDVASLLGAADWEEARRSPEGTIHTPISGGMLHVFEVDREPAKYLWNRPEEWHVQSGTLHVQHWEIVDRHDVVTSMLASDVTPIQVNAAFEDTGGPGLIQRPHTYLRPLPVPNDTTTYTAGRRFRVKPGDVISILPVESHEDPIVIATSRVLDSDVDIDVDHNPLVFTRELSSRIGNASCTIYGVPMPKESVSSFAANAIAFFQHEQAPAEPVGLELNGLG